MENLVFPWARISNAVGQGASACAQIFALEAVFDQLQRVIDSVEYLNGTIVENH